MLAELKLLLQENKTLLSELEAEHKRPVIDKKTEWRIYQDLKELGSTDDDNI